MKIRKILPLALLAAGAVFMLSSCDAMLDAIFSNNTITVKVLVDGLAYTDYWRSGSVVTVDLYGGDGSSYKAGPSASYTVDSDNYVYYSFTFPKLPSMTYTLTAIYHGAIFADYYQTSFTDPSGFLATSITMPYKNGGSSTSVTVTVNF